MCACVPNLDLYNGNTISEINSNIFAIGVVGKQLPSQSKVVTMCSEFLRSEISHVTVFMLGGVKSACKDPSFVQSLVTLATSRMAFLDLNLHVLEVATSNSNN